MRNLILLRGDAIHDTGRHHVTLYWGGCWCRKWYRPAHSPGPSLRVPAGVAGGGPAIILNLRTTREETCRDSLGLPGLGGWVTKIQSEASWAVSVAHGITWTQIISSPTQIFR